MPKKINKLSSVNVAELSLVRRGANNKRIALTKSEDVMEFNEIAKGIIEAEAEGEKELIETLKSQGTSEDAINAAVCQFRFAAGFRDQISDSAMTEITKAAGYKASEKEDEEQENMEGDTVPFAGKKKKKDKQMAKSEENKLEELQKAFDQTQAEVAELRKSIEDRDAKIASREAELEAVKKTARRAELIKECETDFVGVPGVTYEEMADALMDAPETLQAMLRKSWKETSEAITASNLMNSVGNRSAAHSGNAEVKMETLVKEVVEKSAGKISEAKAWDAVIRENPDLYEEYLSENPSQGGSR